MQKIHSYPNISSDQSHATRDQNSDGPQMKTGGLISPFFAGTTYFVPTTLMVKKSPNICVTK